MSRVSSWNCHGCTNVCYRLCPDGEVAEFCRPVMETGKNRTKWITMNYVDCLDKTDDPDATDNEVKIYEWKWEK